MSTTRTIQTLDPQKMHLLRQKAYDLSGKTVTSFRVPSENSTLVPIYYHMVRGIRIRFPPGTVGVLYYKQPPPYQSLLAGGLRFRVIADGAHFDEGEDLRMTNGTVWHAPLCKIAQSAGWNGIRMKLIRESLVEEGVVTDLQKLSKSNKGKVNFHYELGQPFVFDFKRPKISRVFITRSAKHPFKWSCFQGVHRNGKEIPENTLYRGKSLDFKKKITMTYKMISTAAGRILARLELSEPFTTPAIEQRVVLRVLDILKPLQSLRPNNDFLEPLVPGGLLMRKNYSRANTPLSCSLKKRSDGRNIAEFAGLHWS